jgi:hypothetical protein
MVDPEEHGADADIADLVLRHMPVGRLEPLDAAAVRHCQPFRENPESGNRKSEKLAQGHVTSGGSALGGPGTRAPPPGAPLSVMPATSAVTGRARPLRTAEQIPMRKSILALIRSK